MEQNTTTSVSLIDKPDTAQRFAKIFAAVHNIDIEKAANMFEVEKFSFERELQEKAIEGITDISKTGVFLDVISNGLSFSGQMKHVYLSKRNVKTGRKENGKDVYETRLIYATAPDGKIFLAQKAGSIERVTKPVIVYEGDDFGISSDKDGKAIIVHKAKFPRNPGAKIIAGYVYTVFPDGSREPYWMEDQDILRLQNYSAKSNRKWENGAWNNGTPNALYTSQNNGIDAGFFGAKLINFALKNIRRAGLKSINEVEEIEYEQVDTPHSEFVADSHNENDGIDKQHYSQATDIF